MRVVRQSPLIVAALVACAPPAAQVEPAWPELRGPFEVGRLEIDVTDASRDETFTGDPTDKRRLAFMTDVLFSDLPAEQRIAQAGEVDPAAAFVQISAWAGDFMAEHVRDAK